MQPNQTPAEGKDSAKRKLSPRYVARLVSLLPSWLRCEIGIHDYEHGCRSLGFDSTGGHLSVCSDFCIHCDHDRYSKRINLRKEEFLG